MVIRGDYMSLEEIEKNQLQNWNKVLQYVSEYSPFYKQKNLPKSISRLSEVTQLPFTSKGDMQMHNDLFRAIPIGRVADFPSTTGTLGKPVDIWLSDSDLDRLAINEADSFRIADVRVGDVIQLTTTMNKRFMAGLAYFLGARQLGAGIIRVGSGVPQMQWDAILRQKPQVLIAVPSFVVRLLEFAKEAKIRFQETSVKKIICIGEPVRNADFSWNTLGEKILKDWDVTLFGTYASTEMQTAFTECKHGRGGHLLHNLVYPEIIDDNGKVLAPGEPGELVVTTFGVEGTPLIRFKTGDITRMHTDTCRCGRTSCRLGPIEGRRQQMLKVKGTTLFPAAIYDVLESLADIAAYVVEVSKTDLETDSLKIYLATHTLKENITFDIREQLQSRLRVMPEIVVLTAEEIKKLQFPEGARKAVKFIDKRF